MSTSILVNTPRCYHLHNYLGRKMLKINWSVPIKAYFGYPITGVTVLLVFSLHFSGGSGRCLVEPYHAEEFIQLKAFNWIVWTVCSLLRCGRNRLQATVQGSPTLFSPTGLTEQKGTKSPHWRSLAFYFIAVSGKNLQCLHAYCHFTLWGKINTKYKALTIK